MNLIDESFETKKTDNSKKIAGIILAIIVILVIAIIGIFIAILYIQDSTLKLYLNGSTNEKVKEMMVVESNGTIYFPIKDIAAYLGYESYNGEYTDKSEDASKCYIQNEDEIANFALNSNKIYKLTISNNNANYYYYYAAKPVKAMNGKLYATSDAIENAFNISFSYNADKQRAYIYTMPYLIDAYTAKVLDYGYEAISDNFTNKKTVLNDMLVVTKNQNRSYGVIDVKGNTIIEAKYDYIEYLPNSGDFLVKSNNKVGIISAKRETKIQILYDSLELIDSNTLDVKEEYITKLIDIFFKKEEVVTHEVEKEIKEKKKSKKGPIIFALILLLIGLGAFIYLRNNKELIYGKNIYVRCDKVYTEEEIDANIRVVVDLTFNNSSILKEHLKEYTFKFNDSDIYYDFKEKNLQYTYISDSGEGKFIDEEITYKLFVTYNLIKDYDLPRGYDELFTYYQNDGYNCSLIEK